MFSRDVALHEEKNAGGTSLPHDTVTTKNRSTLIRLDFSSSPTKVVTPPRNSSSSISGEKSTVSDFSSPINKTDQYPFPPTADDASDSQPSSLRRFA